ncbi:MAG: SRPBCC family protein [Candidatus Binatia bacterium]
MATLYRCRDDVVVPAASETCFAVLRDIGTYGRWWTLVRVEPVAGGTRLRPGVRIRFRGRRPGRAEVSWVTRVTAVHAPLRLELEYDEGDLLGTTGWELEAAPDGTRVAYVYYGVRPASPAAATTFGRYGTQLHSLAMREDALAGLARLFGGAGAELDDAAWRARVEARLAAGVRALG